MTGGSEATGCAKLRLNSVKRLQPLLPLRGILDVGERLLEVHAAGREEGVHECASAARTGVGSHHTDMALEFCTPIEPFGPGLGRRFDEIGIVDQPELGAPEQQPGAVQRDPAIDLVVFLRHSFWLGISFSRAG